MADFGSVNFDPGTFKDSGWGSIDKGIFGGSGSAPDYSGGNDYWGKGAIDTSAFGGTKGLYGGDSGIDWGGTFSSLFKKAAQNRFSDNDPYGKGSTGFGGGGWGSQNSVDIGGGNTVVTTGGGSPMYIPGEKAQSNAGKIGSLVGMALAAPFSFGGSFAAGMGALGGAGAIGSGVGSMFS